MECNSCGATFGNDLNVCPYCRAAKSNAILAEPQTIAHEQLRVTGPPVKPKGKFLVFLLLILFCWPAAIWYAIKHDISR